MNIIATGKRNFLLVENISHLMTVKHLAEWDATPFVKSSSRLGHHTAADNRVKKKGDTEY
jgi:hypothetical protein